MLSEAFPGIRSSVRIRTTSESSAATSSSTSSNATATRTATTHHRCGDLLHPAGWPPQRPTQGEEGGGGGGGAKGGNSHFDTLLELPGPRSRTGSKGIRDFLRLVTRSSVAAADDGGDRKSANGCHGDGCHGAGGGGGGHVVAPSRLSQLRDSMRQRSRSDADSMQRLRKRNPCPAPAPAPAEGEGEPEEDERGGDPLCPGDGWGRGCCDPPKSHRLHHHEALTTLRVSGFPVSNGDAANPIHSPLSPLGRVKTPTHIGPAEFIELYRHRAHSDPRPQVRMAALANVRRKKAPPAARLASSPGYVAMDSLQEKKLILWKDKKDGNQLLVLPGNDSDDATVESIKLDRRVQLTYCELLRATKCYDIIPSSTKMVILDSQLSVKKALYALLNNGIRSAPLWDSQTQQLSGMLTVTDFILVLQRYYLSQPESVESLEDESISAFKAIVGSTVGQLTSIQPEENLLDAIFALRHHAVHRLPVIDPSTGNIIYMMTYKRLLHFLQTAISKNAAPFINKTIDELKIGSYDDIATLSLDSSVIDALELLVDRRVSSLPVLDSRRKLVSMFSRADVINMAADKTYSRLDATIGETDHGGETMFCVDSTTTCQKTDTLMSVVTKLSRREIHRLPVLDESGHVIGVVSVSDVVRFIAKQTEVRS